MVDVPATLSARVRLLQTGHGRKTDAVDATAVAMVCLHRQLKSVTHEGDTELFRLLTDRRDSLVEERRRNVNRLHRHLRDLVPGGAAQHLSADSAAKVLSRVRPVTKVQIERKKVTRELLTDIRRLDRALADNRKSCAEAVAQSGTRLTGIYGISDVLAVKILGHTGDITRFPTSDHFASYAGTAPIEASSGETVRHRLSRSGNRQLNHAIHMAAHVQIIRASRGRDYYRKKIAEGKNPAEAKRALKRQITKSIYNRLRQDAHQSLPAAA